VNIKIKIQKEAEFQGRSPSGRPALLNLSSAFFLEKDRMWKVGLNYGGDLSNRKSGKMPSCGRFGHGV